MSPGVQLVERWQLIYRGWSALAKVGQDIDPGGCWGLVYATLLGFTEA